MAYFIRSIAGILESGCSFKVYQKWKVYTNNFFVYHWEQLNILNRVYEVDACNRYKLNEKYVTIVEIWGDVLRTMLQFNSIKKTYSQIVLRKEKYLGDISKLNWFVLSYFSFFKQKSTVFCFQFSISSHKDVNQLQKEFCQN